MRERGRGGKPRKPLRRMGVCPSFAEPLKMCRCFVLERNEEQSKMQAEANDRKLALEAVWRGACEELGMPVTGDCERFKYRNRTLDLDQHHRGSGHCNGRCRMDRDAQWAMVGGGVHRVDVRHLDYSQKCQQDKTHHGHQLQCTRLCAAFPAQKCLKSCQHTYPCSKNTHLLDALTPEMVRDCFGFSCCKIAQPSLLPLV
jgi:hypothetical protein